MDFLRHSRNKEELFDFLTHKVANLSCTGEKSLYVTARQDVVSSTPMFFCNHEKADARIVVHIMHALENAAKSFQIRTVDTDVVAILVDKFHNFIAIQPLVNIWVAFGTGKHFCFYHINSICEKLGEPMSRSLPEFHAFSGCNTTSSFLGVGKRSAWQS